MPVSVIGQQAEGSATVRSGIPERGRIDEFHALSGIAAIGECSEGTVSLDALALRSPQAARGEQLGRLVDSPQWRT